MSTETSFKAGQATPRIDGPVPADVPEELVQALLALRPKD